MNNPWVVTQLEFQQNEIQFITLKPENGLLTGEQARAFMIKSTLPPPILAQVWNMADMNRDGRLDKMEFAVAVKLIRNALAGLPLPPTLPDSMRQVQPAPPTPYMRPPAFGMPQMPPGPNYGPTPATVMHPTEFVMGTKETGDWAIPHPQKLKYAQRFNQLDKERKDYLTGQQVRGVMGESQLPAHVLGQIWNLADANKEGFLTIEKFCVAMFLIDQVKYGYALPRTLPAELQTFVTRAKTASPALSPGDEPPQKTPQLKTFEDKRRDNLDKGEAELERRRQILREEEERRKAEIERKEREEQERREQERLQLEQKRLAELEAQRQRDMEREEARRVEEEKLRAEREEARKKAEEERMKLLEQRHVKDLETQLQAEKEKTAQIQQRHKTMTFQLQGLEEKAQQLANDANASRDEIIAITSEIEAMRGKRDEKVAKIQELQTKNQQLAVQCERVSHENLQLQTECQKVLSRSKEIDQLRKSAEDRREQIRAAQTEIADASQRLDVQKKLVAEKRPEFDDSEAKMHKLHLVYADLLQQFVAKQKALHDKVNAKRGKTHNNHQPLQQTNNFNAFPAPDLYEAPPDAQQFNNAFASAFADPFANAQPQHHDPFTPAQPAVQQAPHSLAHHQPNGDQPPVKYRALYEFVARSEDELGLQPGDIVLVFEGHASEPGWLAGQIKDKVGWFPAAFAEPVTKKTAPGTSPLPPPTSSTPASPSTEPLASIKEEPAAEKELTTEQSATAAQPNAHVFPTPTPALYDAPPGDVSATTTAATKSPPTTHHLDVARDRHSTSHETVITVGVAQFSWKARYDTEISFTKGDTIEIVEKTDMKLKGKVQGKPGPAGWFPKSYVKLQEGQAPSTADSTSLPHSTSQHSTTSAPKTPTTPVQSLPISTAAHLNNPTSAPTTTSAGEWYRAMFQFDAVESTDLDLRVGERVLVTEKEGEWWHGTSASGRSGIFPSNYVQRDDNQQPDGAPPALPTQSAPTQPSTQDNDLDKRARAIAAFAPTGDNQLALYVGDLIHVHAKNPSGWWEGELERDGCRHVGWFPGNYVELLSAANTPVAAGAVAEAAFDYTAQHDDELSFRTGQLIEVVERTDPEWWKGRVQGTDGPALLFPCNFVQLRVAVGSKPTVKPRHAAQSQGNFVRAPELEATIQELKDTESRFAEDLLLVRNVFMKPMTGVLDETQLNRLFLNWNDLIKLSKRIESGLQHRAPGDLFCRRIDALEAYVTFCEGQQSSLDYLAFLDKTEPRFRKLHHKCQQNEAVRGVSLSYFLLIPMARVTRYPLIFEKLLKLTDRSDPDYENLHNAHQLLQSLCARVNVAISEVENKNVLCWSQTHVHAAASTPESHLEFTSETRLLGPRRFLHSGLVHKLKSHRQLVILLYNDMLVLAEPRQPINDASKIAKSEEVHLDVYKVPLTLDTLRVCIVPHTTDALELKDKNLSIQLRANDSNEQTFWLNQIQKAIDDHDVTAQLRRVANFGTNTTVYTWLQSRTTPLDVADQPEAALVSFTLQGLSRTDLPAGPILVEYALDEWAQPRCVEVGALPTGESASMHTDALRAHSIRQDLRLRVAVKRRFRPDVQLGVGAENVLQLVRVSAHHRGPLVRLLPLSDGQLPGPPLQLVLRFVIQLKETP